MHKHFKEKFQSKQAYLNQLAQSEDDNEDKIPAISDRNKQTISNETKKAVEKLKDTSSPGPDGVTSKLAKLLYKKLPKIFNKMHIQYFNGAMRHFNDRNLKVI